MEEIWKDIPNYNGYQVSNLGRIRTHNKITFTKKHGLRHWKDRILSFKPFTNSNQKSKQGMGYRVDLWKDGKPKTRLPDPRGGLLQPVSEQQAHRAV